jgi:purine-binding chemotaxis protein CheW
MDAGVHQLVVFDLADQRYALHLSTVEKVHRVVQVTALPKAPACVVGIVNIGGTVVPVIDIRKRFGLPVRQIRLSDHIIVARTSRRTVALVADAVSGVARHERADVTAAPEIVANLGYVEGVIRLNGDLILVHDLDTFLSVLEEEQLERAMTAGTTGLA